LIDLKDNQKLAPILAKLCHYWLNIGLERTYQSENICKMAFEKKEHIKNKIKYNNLLLDILSIAKTH
jgi:hypothetical protein